MEAESQGNKKTVNPTPPSPPKYIVLDTNVLLRLLILDFGTKEAIGIPTLAKKADSQIILAPCQEDEFWRNASEVLWEHTKRWSDIARDARKAIGDLIQNLKACRALGILEDSQEKILKDLGKAKQLLDRIRERQIEWPEFESFADRSFSVMRKMTEDAGYDRDMIRERAEERVARSNPPCRDKKPRPLGDCMIWEVVLALLERKEGVCWFATTDSDYSDHSDVHTLNRLLNREATKAGGKLVFIHEDRTLGLLPGTQFKVLAQLAEAIPGNVTEQMRRDLEALSFISPGMTLMEFEEALQQLSYRERNILGLQLGFGDGFDYKQSEIARIFKLSQPRISQIVRATIEKIRKHNERSADE